MLTLQQKINAWFSKNGKNIEIKNKLWTKLLEKKKTKIEKNIQKNVFDSETMVFRDDEELIKHVLIN